MYYHLPINQEEVLLNLPETGMGFQVIEAARAGRYDKERFIVLNAEIVIEINGHENLYIKEIVNEGILNAKRNSVSISLHSISVYSESQFRKFILNESRFASSNGAIDNIPEPANGDEIFVRLSAFEDDKRIDRKKHCLRPGSYTTTLDDYANCKSANDSPVERYALPNDEKIKWAFYIRPKSGNSLQRGIVQPAYGKRGGGKEVYFGNGTSPETFITQSPY